MEQLWSILVSALSGGFAVQLINIWRNRKLSKARQGSNIDTAYIENINMLREELVKIQDENRKLYKAIARLDRTVAKASACRYWDNCPIRDELQKSGHADRVRPARRQPAKCPQGRNPPEAGAAEHGEDCLSDGLAEGDTGGDGIR